MSDDATGYDRDNVFARILRGEIPSDRVYEDDEFIAFRDINPAAPTHIVLIPRGEPPAGPSSLEDGDAGWAGRMLVVASRIAAREGLGWEYVALLCAHEMKVPGGLPKCIRVLLIANSDKRASEVVNVYARDAVNLRSQSSES